MTDFELIRTSVQAIMGAVKEGKFTLEELEFLEEFFYQGSLVTAEVIERKKETDNEKS